MKQIFIIGLLLVVSCTNYEQAGNMKIKELTPLDIEFSTYFNENFENIMPLNLFVAENNHSKVLALTNSFYSRRHYLPLWTTDLTPNKKSNEFLNLIKNAQQYGFRNEFYAHDYLSELYKKLLFELDTKKSQKLTVCFETAMTNTCLVFLSNLSYGVFMPDTAIYVKIKEKFSTELLHHFEKLALSEHFKDDVLKFQPELSEYKNLQAALVKYLQTTKITDKKYSIPDIKADSIACYQTARLVLLERGFLDDTLVDSDSAFFVALQNFQQYNGLKRDSIIGKNTRYALKRTTLEQYKHIVVSLEKLRWDTEIEDPYLYINLPTYQLRIVKNKQVVDTFRVIIGHVHTPTPLLTSYLENIITYPQWHVPHSISSKEMLPKIREDVNYLAKNNYRIYDQSSRLVNPDSINWDNITRRNFNYRIKQRSGHRNALGTIKFLFPNPYSVYLHDTPTKHLFSREIRAYSHGCMRLHRPIEFGKILLAQAEVNTDLDSVMKNRKRKWFTLDNPVQVRVRYNTCEADNDSNVYFYRDIYQYEDSLIQLFFSDSIFNRYRYKKTKPK